MKLEELNTSQMFLVGTIMARIGEETEKGLKDVDDEDTKIAMKYVLTKLDEINKEIAEEVRNQAMESIRRMQNLFNED